MFTSIEDIKSLILFLNLSTKSKVFPSSEEIASFLALSVLLSSKSNTASDLVKSILPFKNALFVNSPGSANLAPLFNNSSNTLFVVVIPP